MPLKRLLIFLVLISPVWAGEPLIRTNYFYAKGGESLTSFLTNGLGLPKSLVYEKTFLKQIKKWNPAIEDFNKLLPGQRVYVEVPFRISLPVPRISPSLVTPGFAVAGASKKERKPAQVNTLKSDQGKFFAGAKEEDSPWNFSLFYALSRGTFQEQAKNADIQTTSSQDSPFTLGVAAFRPLENNFNFSGSAYFSKLDGAVSSDSGAEVSIPWEYGVTGYLGYKTPEMPVEVYGGFDYERFSSFNTGELILGEKISTREHTLLYGTLGVAKTFEWLNKRFLFKGSFSVSLTSDQSRPSIVNPEPFAGNKAIVYLNMKASKNWFYHGFIKQHQLEGATELTIRRIGLGFGYIF